MSATEKRRPVWRRIVRAVLTALLAVVLIALFYVAVVMGHPQDDGAVIVEAATDQPLLGDADPVIIVSEADMGSLLNAFPAPVMQPLAGSPLLFGGGECRSVPYEDGFARVATISYRTEGGAAFTVQSIYPARALTLVGKDGFTIDGRTGQSLSGLRSVRMESNEQIRLYAQGQEALYVVTTAKLDTAVLRQLTSALQLFEAE